MRESAQTMCHAIATGRNGFGYKIMPVAIRNQRSCDGGYGAARDTQCECEGAGWTSVVPRTIWMSLGVPSAEAEKIRRPVALCQMPIMSWNGTPVVAQQDRSEMKNGLPTASATVPEKHRNELDETTVNKTWWR